MRDDDAVRNAQMQLIGCHAVDGGRFLLVIFNDGQGDICTPIPAEQLVKALFAPASGVLGGSRMARLDAIDGQPDLTWHMKVVIDRIQRGEVRVDVRDLMTAPSR